MPFECSGSEPGSFGEPRLWTDQWAPAVSAQLSTDQTAEEEMQGIGQNIDNLSVDITLTLKSMLNKIQIAIFPNSAGTVLV